MPEDPKNEKSSENKQPAQDSLEAPASESASTDSQQPEDSDNSSDSLSPDAADAQTTASSTTDGSNQTEGNPASDNIGEADKKPKGPLNSANLYLIGFVLLLAVAAGIIVYALTRSSQESGTKEITSHNLSSEALQQLANSNTTVGDSDQLLTVQSNAIFQGQVLAQKNLEIAGDLKIGGNLSLPNLVVSGTSQFGSAQINKDLAVAGNTAIQGKLSVKGNFSAGAGHFNGPVTASQISANSLQLSGDLSITHHISAGGGTPAVSRGSAVGGGGSVSVSGSDTTGSISISTGSNPPAGCLVSLNFTQSFHATPHVVVTPVGSAAGRLQYYISRNTSSFRICTANPASGGANFGFDYIVFD